LKNPAGAGFVPSAYASAVQPRSLLVVPPFKDQLAVSPSAVPQILCIGLSKDFTCETDFFWTEDIHTLKMVIATARRMAGNMAPSQVRFS
jgi:hypothetical protein